jgi:hypothetical protein
MYALISQLYDLKLSRRQTLIKFSRAVSRVSWLIKSTKWSLPVKHSDLSLCIHFSSLPCVLHAHLLVAAPHYAILLSILSLRPSPLSALFLFWLYLTILSACSDYTHTSF